MENTLYNEIVKTTAVMASVSETSIPSSKGYLKRWNLLSDFWYENLDVFGDVFYSAVKHMATGRYPNNSRASKPLLILVEKAILSETEALRAWRKNGDFIYDFARVVISLRNRKDSSVRRFALDRLYALTFYREEFDKPINLVTASLRQIRKAQSRACVRNGYENFIKSINALIPESTTWTTRQWTSEKHIFAAIKSVHGVDYTKDTAAFDRIVSMMKHKMNGQPYYYELFKIKHLPLSMAAAIWPKNIIKELSKQFLIASNVKPVITDGEYRPDNDSVAPSVVNTSWAYRILVSHRKSRELSKAVTDNLMYFGWGEHPHVMRAKQRVAADAAIQSA